jgi:hypothetical protein
VPASHLLRVLIGPREKRLCQRLEARFAREALSVGIGLAAIFALVAGPTKRGGHPFDLAAIHHY